jgi:hypothetical protein
MNIVVRCSCGGVSTYVENSIKTLGLQATTYTYVGKEKIKKLAAGYPDTNLASHLETIAKKSGRYAFYISTTGAPDDKVQDISALYNLITGKRVY